MRKHSRISLLAALACGALLAAPAYAVTVTRVDGQPMNPNGEPFSTSGTASVSKGSISAACAVTMSGVITQQAAVTITSVQFAGGALCNLISGSASSAAPWTGQADSPTQLSINNMQAQVTGLGNCGPSKVVASWDDPSSSLSMNNAALTPDCKISGTVTSSPKFHVQ